MLVCSFICSNVCGIYHEVFHKVARKFLKWGISYELHIRKHSYLDHGYVERSASMPCILVPGFMPRDGAGGQNLGHLLKVFFYFFVMETTYADSWSNMAQRCEIDL